MQLLLFLSALLAGLTGAFSGDRAVRMGGQQSAATITRAAETVAEIAASTVAARISFFTPVVRPARAIRFALHAAPQALPIHLMIGRRLE